MISIIIPTYNDSDNLDKCLEHINTQNIGEDFEVIVVDDGSTDNTQKILSKWRKTPFVSKNDKWKLHDGRFFNLKILDQENKKQGAARNFGVKESSGDIIIFIGSDIFVQKNWLKTHKEFHNKHKNKKWIGLGHISWSKDISNDRFRIWLETSGYMVTYKGLKNNKRTDYWHFYTGNISIKKDFFEEYYFDEKFSSYGFEDIMLGYQMLKDDAKLIYLKNALAHHHHPLKESHFFPHRMLEIGKSAVHFHNIYPQVPVIPKGFKKFVFICIGLSPVVFILKYLKKEWYWYALSKKLLLKGIKSVS